MLDFPTRSKVCFAKLVLKEHRGKKVEDLRSIFTAYGFTNDTPVMLRVNSGRGTRMALTTFGQVPDDSLYTGRANKISGPERKQGLYHSFDAL
jgi:hypothetical protein